MWTSTLFFHRMSTTASRTALATVQSALLQEVRGVLLPTYPNTTIQSGPAVVLVEFGSYAVEVAPAFLLTDGRYWICDTTGAGRYKVANPIAEASIFIR